MTYCSFLVCDRCKVETERNSAQSGWWTVELSPLGHSNDTKREFDLCPGCRKSLLRFIDENIGLAE